jgi:hypothetical protein
VWSNSADWPSKIVPVANESVEILPQWQMLVDIDTADLNILTIRGTLKLKADKAISLNANIVHI